MSTKDAAPPVPTNDLVAPSDSNLWHRFPVHPGRKCPESPKKGSIAFQERIGRFQFRDRHPVNRRDFRRIGIHLRVFGQLGQPPTKMYLPGGSVLPEEPDGPDGGAQFLEELANERLFRRFPRLNATSGEAELSWSDHRPGPLHDQEPPRAEDNPDRAATARGGGDGRVVHAAFGAYLS